MSSSVVKLKQIAIFNASDGHSEISVKTVAKMDQGKIDPGEVEIWNRVPMLIPEFLPPSYLGRKGIIIDLTYSLLFEVKPSGMGRSLQSQIPIMIGTKPYGNNPFLN
eukprot:TRINITY_DN17924_c0_g1_i16.p1 TRINITY_DN17924_c0_g1~~TRINITY_DN17924_c0_g1_i16.p1  ORF type:complete len:107 (-),score=5.86 TRINITY_DN17924_c0_g1_i16:1-321(-)